MRDPVELEVFRNLYHSIAEEMGATLRRTSFSPNIKERRDYSCAVFDSAGHVIAMGDHMPVHLGSMPMSVAAAVQDFSLDPGDVVMLNDPFRGGTHLPDITLVMPVYVSEAKRTQSSATAAKPPRLKSVRSPDSPDFYVASRAHHADVGGMYPGSMGPCREIYQEGLRIPPVKLMRGGEMVDDILALVLNNVRTPDERKGDLGAQIAACQTGADRLLQVCASYGVARAQAAATNLLAYSEEMMSAFLRTIPAGSYQAEDFLDDDGVQNKLIRIAVNITIARIGKIRFLKTRSLKTRFLKTPLAASPATDSGARAHQVTIDFTGTDPQVQGAINAVEAITYSACFYVFRCLLRDDVPATSGLMRPIRLIAPSGTVVNARSPAAVAGGNVETSQRIVDVLLKALSRAIPDRIPAAASGTMNNLTIGGIDPRSGESFAYYETIAGGMGARPSKDGVSGVHTHMTNSLNTPAEALEYAYPLRVREYSLRRNSGGSGQHRGGDGIVREIEVLSDAQVTLLADRRSRGPYGLAGGASGQCGRTSVVRVNGDSGKSRDAEEIPGKTSIRLKKGERVRIESPGGGGWGST